MDEPLLSSLCSICYIDPPKYTCPRCFSQTCSLNCSKRHKIWSSCNGTRDPTVYKPISQVATPSGIDHDYNFLHSIELGIERSEKVLIEDLSLVSREELKSGGSSESGGIFRKKHNQANQRPGEANIREFIQNNNIQVVKAPKGMRRNKENTTIWNRKKKTIYWQVEWLRGLPCNRILHRISGAESIGSEYDVICEEESRMKMTDEERKEDRKRKAQELRFQVTKKRKLDPSNCLSLGPALLQDPETKTWRMNPNMGDHQGGIANDTPREPVSRNLHFYIHRPLTPASFPKVIAEIDPNNTLTEVLANRCVLEYPTIYVLDQNSSQLPANFMLEKDYDKVTKPNFSNSANNGEGKNRKIDEQSEDSSNTTDDSCDSESSSSSSCSSSDKEEIKITGI